MPEDDRIHLDVDGKAVMAGIDPATGEAVNLRVTNITQGANGEWYGDLAGTSGGLSTNDGSFAKETGGHLQNVDANTAVLGNLTDSAAANGSVTSASLAALLRGILLALAAGIPIEGLLPTSTYQALSLDANGYLLTSGTNPNYESNSGGPANANSIATGLNLDRRKNAQGKGVASGTITATLGNDVNLSFSVAPTTLTAGPVILYGASGGPEMIYTSDSWVPNGTTTTVPLKNNVVQAGHTHALWSIFTVLGPTNTHFTADGVGLTALAGFDANSPNTQEPYAQLQVDNGALRSNMYYQTNTLADTAVSKNAPMPTQRTTSSTGNLSSVAAATSGTQLLAANTSRKGALFFNDSTATLYLGFCVQGSVSTTNYTVKIGAGGYYELPPHPNYQGVISGVWSAVNGSVRITEVV